MADQGPAGEAMSRDGKGTAAAGEAGNSRRLVGPALFVCSKDTTRKSRNLEADGRCVVTTDTGDLHLILEDTARRVGDAATLRRASDAFKAIYDWPTSVAGGKLDADYGAPTSGGPPDDAYEITPTRVFALPTDGESTTPTRWRFSP